MNILFFPLKSRVDKNGMSRLMLRITLSPTDKAEWPTGKKVAPNLWDNDTKKVSGKSVNADIVNKYVVFAENKLNKILSDLELSESIITAEIIKNKFLGGTTKISLIGTLKKHNEIFKQKIGKKGFNTSTYSKYLVLEDKISFFIKNKYKRSDLFIEEININFIESFWEFLTLYGKKDLEEKYTLPLNEETSFGVMGRLKKITKIALREQQIGLNPFDSFKPVVHKNKREPLTIEEVFLIINKKLKLERLNKAKDRMIVALFTGLADSDIQKATTDMVTIGLNGIKILNIRRTKTDELSLIPLYRPVLDIIEKYKGNPECVRYNKLFPQLSNQKMNNYIGEITDLCNINKNITTHVLRHTFATLYLNNGGTLEGLAKILGHSNTSSTRIYASRNSESVSKESNIVMDNVFKLLNMEDDPDNVKKLG